MRYRHQNQLQSLSLLLIESFTASNIYLEISKSNWFEIGANIRILLTGPRPLYIFYGLFVPDRTETGCFMLANLA